MQSWPSIPRSIPRWFYRHPATLTAMLGWLNRLRRLATLRRRGLAVGISAIVGGVLVALAASGDDAAFAVRQASSHAGIVVAATGLYAASLVSRRRRALKAAAAGSWLIATPRTRSTGDVTVLLPVLGSLLWRLVAAGALALLASLNAAVMIEQSLQLGALIAAGAAAGAPLGWWLARRSTGPGRESSRYMRRPRRAADSRPSGAALSRWPVAQALAWGRPENARLLLAAAIILVPGGTGLLAAIGILVTWIVASYLGALLVAVPHAARAASDWLRSTPITFWAFAWPLARRALLHQLCGTLFAIAVMLALGASPFTALYLGAVWLATATLVAALSLADCYRARRPAVKIWVSIGAVLLAEERAHGWGVSLAMLLAAWHLRSGARHARA